MFDPKLPRLAWAGTAGLAHRHRLRYGAGMAVMIWIGVALSVGGLGGVLWCIRHASWLKRAELDDNTARAELNRLIVAHMASIGAALLGLGLLVAGLLLR